MNLIKLSCVNSIGDLILMLRPGFWVKAVVSSPKKVTSSVIEGIERNMACMIVKKQQVPMTAGTIKPTNSITFNFGSEITLSYRIGMEVTGEKVEVGERRRTALNGGSSL
ncbi:hypothetical protein PV326_001396 [Microctonus aethiopoides]|nr:hypothetical protein PV326_001396 [Microctonus aethiopoides]